MDGGFEWLVLVLQITPTVLPSPTPATGPTLGSPFLDGLALAILAALLGAGSALVVSRKQRGWAQSDREADHIRSAGERGDQHVSHEAEIRDQFYRRDIERIEADIRRLRETAREIEHALLRVQKDVEAHEGFIETMTETARAIPTPRSHSQWSGR